jgi:hypothetical protein
MKPGEMKVFHCGTDSGFDRMRGRKKLSAMTSIHSSRRVDSATDDILLTNIFPAAGAVQVKNVIEIFVRERKICRSIRTRSSGDSAGFAEIFR